MSSFAVPVSLYMSSPVHTLPLTASLDEARAGLDRWGVSALAVVDSEQGRVVGSLSRQDLLRLGRLEAGRRPGDANLTLPPRTVGDEMSDPPPFVAPETELGEVARTMVEARTHRVLVGRPDDVQGILTTRELMEILEAQQDGQPVSAWMSSPVFTIRAEEPVSQAIERLERARVTGLVVVEHGWPVGLFTEIEALAARDLPRQTPVGEAMGSRLLVLAPETRMHRAAAQARATRVRRVVVQDKERLVGILTGLDFARVVAH